MSSLGAQFCYNHPVREAAGRCPECGRTYCRECIADHDGRILCAACIQKLIAAEQAPARKTGQWFRALLLPVRLAVALVISWLCFYTVGRMLLAIPSEFHSGAVWDPTGEMIDNP